MISFFSDNRVMHFVNGYHKSLIMRASTKPKSTELSQDSHLITYSIQLQSRFPTFFAQKYFAVGNSIFSPFRLNDSLFDFLIAVILDPNPLDAELRNPTEPSSSKLFNSFPLTLVSLSGMVTLVTPRTISSATCQANSSFIFSFSSLVTKFFTTLPNRDVFLVPCRKCEIEVLKEIWDFDEILVTFTF